MFTWGPNYIEQMGHFLSYTLKTGGVISADITAALKPKRQHSKGFADLVIVIKGVWMLKRALGT